MTAFANSTSGVRSVGGLLPLDFLSRIRNPKANVGGLSGADYHLADNERLGEMINRSWNRLVDAWKSFYEKLSEIQDPNEAARSLTRERWLGPLFNELGFGRLPAAKGVEINGQSYPLSNEWQQIPIHLVGARVPLDRRSAGVRGAAGMSPHALVQEILNRSENYLWGIVSNGLTVRLLRDSTSLTRQSYIEFDLEVIFTNERYEDFVTLWMVLHQSRFEGESLSQCHLEKWRSEINSSGVRALDALRGGVEAAIKALGRGFLAHPENRELRTNLQSGQLQGDEYYREILRLVYRILFLFVAEDRDLLHSVDVDRKAKDRYSKWYSTKRLRDQAWGIRSDRHDDMWQLLTVVMDGLGRPSGIKELGISPLGSFLWSEDAVPHLSKCRIANSFFGESLVHLSTTLSEGVRRSVDFANLGAEELGSVYEALLELYPEIEVGNASFALRSSSGNERKTSGSYYTPRELVASLLESALDPVLDRAAKEKDPEQAILNLKVFDPACGSGHFLIAAAHRIAQRLAQVRTGEPEATPTEVRHALREVVARCCYGVDINPMAVELAKVSLWMEAMEPGKPLTYLERHIVVGNALFGATPELVADGIPDEAYDYLEGDSKETIKEVKALNKKIRSRGVQTLNLQDRSPNATKIVQKVSFLESLPDDDLEAIAKKAALWDEVRSSIELDSVKLAADLWCAAFVYKKVPNGAEITSETVRLALEIGRSAIASRELEAAESLSEQYKFLHFHVAFPEVFSGGGDGIRSASLGFDAVLGNPPWEKVKLAEKEFFATKAPNIVEAKGASRKSLIKELESSDPALFAAYQAALRQASGESKFIIKSRRYPLTGKGDVNTYAIFAELARNSINRVGRCGIIVPTGIATDDSTSEFFSDLVAERSLANLYDFENSKPIFPGVHRSYKFCLLTLAGSARSANNGTEFVFFAHGLDDLNNPERRLQISSEEIKLFNPNTGTTPIFRNRKDLDIARQVYRKVPVMIKEGPPEENSWGISFKTLFHMTNDSHLFKTRSQCEEAGGKLEGNVFVNEDGSRLLPLYEGKLIHHFDHRFATYEGVSGDTPLEVPGKSKEDANFAILPRYWVSEREVQAKLGDWDHKWMIGFRGIARTTDERTLISAAYPISAVGNSFPILLSPKLKNELAACLTACISSFALDFIARLKVGGTNFNFYIVKQLPILPPETFDDIAPWSDDPSETLSSWISKRVLELTYTAHEMKPWAEELGYSGGPFKYDLQRRMLLRAELDACFFHLYGYRKDQVEYAMESFPIIKKHDIDRYGEYRTKKLILERFEELTLFQI